MGDVIVLAILGLSVFWIVFSMIRKRKNSGGSCSGCSSCKMRSACPSAEKETRSK